VVVVAVVVVVVVTVVVVVVRLGVKIPINIAASPIAMNRPRRVKARQQYRETTQHLLRLALRLNLISLRFCVEKS